MSKNKIKIIVVVGPTASGKSSLAIQLARKFNGEVISADSRQVYRGMDIGTGKVKRDKVKIKNSKLKIQYLSEGIVHHLINVVSPRQSFTVTDFKSRAEKSITDILKRGKLLIVCGGTGLYIDTLIYDLNFPEVPPNPKLRAELSKQSTEQLFARLQKLDPDRAKTIDRHNPRRLIRALEIISALGKVPVFDTKFYVLSSKSYSVLWLGLNPNDLEKRITARLNARLNRGMIAEVKKLHQGGLSWQRLYDLGLEYRYVSEYLQNKTSKSNMIDQLKTAILQYSKRQMTWFKRNKNIRWIKSARDAVSLAASFLES